jgi:hypothetical protein
MTSTGEIIRWSTAGAVVGVAAVAAVASYEHAYALVRAHGETGWIGRLIYASSMVMLGSARREVPVPGLARWRGALAVSIAVRRVAGDHGRELGQRGLRMVSVDRVVPGQDGSNRGVIAWGDGGEPAS